jgi:hypothetical protein
MTSSAPTWPRRSGGDNSTKVATTAFVGAALPSLPLPIANGGYGAATAPQNDVFAGPASGGSGAPSMRALVAADLPSSAVTTTGTQTLTNKRATKRVNTLTASANIYTPVSDTTDIALISTPSANFTVATPTYSTAPNDGDSLIIRIASGSTAYTPSWGSAYSGSAGNPLPAACHGERHGLPRLPVERGGI